MGHRPSAAYAPKAPADSVLHRIVRDHFETFRAEATRLYERDALPRFIEEEFHGFLRCGSLAGGFARFHCAGCGLDRLVPFSCKGRAVCPSCGGRRMAERAAHLVDRVFPVVPVRQWVLSLPQRLRYILAWDHALCRAVSGIFVRAVLGDLRRRARLSGTAGGRGGVEGDDQTLRFYEAAPPSDDEMERVLGTADRRVHRFLGRRGVLDDVTADRWHEEAPALAGIAAASVQGRCALGARAGAAVRRWSASADLVALAPSSRGPCHAQWNGFDLHAGVMVPPRDRARLERLCRYALRPPVAHDRLHVTSEGQVVLDLRHRWGGRDDAAGLRSPGTARAARRAHAAAADQPAAVLRRAGCAVRLAAKDCRWGRRPFGGDDGSVHGLSRTRGRQARRQPAVGRVDAAQFRVRCPGVPPLRGPVRADRAHRRRGGDPAHPEPSWAADGRARCPSCPAAAAPDRRSDILS